MVYVCIAVVFTATGFYPMYLQSVGHLSQQTYIPIDIFILGKNLPSAPISVNTGCDVSFVQCQLLCLTSVVTKHILAHICPQEKRCLIQFYVNRLYVLIIPNCSLQNAQISFLLVYMPWVLGRKGWGEEHGRGPQFESVWKRGEIQFILFVNNNLKK